MTGAQENPIERSVDEVFRDFRCRRKGMIKALTSEVEKFSQECDPDKENLCLYGLPNGLWEVNMPVEEVPPELPEPVLGINFAKAGMEEKDWLSLVAVHSDSWLIAVAYYFAARFGFDKNDRKMLYHMINELPTVFEVVSGMQPKELSSTRSNGNQTKPSEKIPRSSEPRPKRVKNSPPPKEDGESDEEDEEFVEEEGTLCGACGQDDYDVDEFWILCDVCERWFHGKCVKMNPAKAALVQHYKCPGCKTLRAH